MTDVYTPATLAKEWHCSERHVRSLVDKGELRAFRLGQRLLRIPAASAREYECRMATGSESSTDNASLSTTTQPESDTVTVLEPLTRVRLNAVRQRSMQS